MNHERTAMIDRYLTGRMSQEEHARFAAEMAKDRSLQAMVEAEELIKGTIHRDLAAISLDHTATQAHVMASLASFTSSAGVGTGGAAAINTAGGGFRRLLLNTSGSVMKGIIIAGVGAGLGVGGYFLLDAGESVETIPAPASPAVTAPVTTPPARLQPPQAPAAQAAEPTAPAETAPDTRAAAAATNRQEHRTEIESKKRETAVQHHVGREEQERSESEQRETPRQTLPPAQEKSAQVPTSNDENRPLPVVKKRSQIPVNVSGSDGKP